MIWSIQPHNPGAYVDTREIISVGWTDRIENKSIFLTKIYDTINVWRAATIYLETIFLRRNFCCCSFGNHSHTEWSKLLLAPKKLPKLENHNLSHPVTKPSICLGNYIKIFELSSFLNLSRKAAIWFCEGRKPQITLPLLKSFFQLVS